MQFACFTCFHMLRTHTARPPALGLCTLADHPYAAACHISETSSTQPPSDYHERHIQHRRHAEGGT
jgi:hypothetical protein